jgi:hypothetical protein
MVVRRKAAIISSTADSGSSTSEKAIGDLDRSDVAATKTRLPGDRADQILGPDPDVAPDTE